MRSLPRTVVATLFLCGATVLPTKDETGKTPAGSEAKKHLELTQVDVFAKPDWRSDRISVMGFYLGMSRKDALETARTNGLDLIASTLADDKPCAVSACALCTKDVCNGIETNFGNDNRIQVIHVMRPLREASKDIRDASVTQYFKGQTYLLFHDYSDELRLKLFGPEASKTEDHKSRSTKYLYPQLGMELYVSLSANERAPESRADLTLSFVLPQDTKSTSRSTSR